MAKINGTDLRVYKDGNLIGYEREFTFSLERDLPDASNKDSAGFAEHIQGQGSASLEFTAMVDFSADYGIQESIAELIARTDIYVSWKDTVSATYFYAGKASYASISQDAPNEDVSSWSGSITINGDWGIYPISITRTLRTTNDNTTYQTSNVFGFDSLNNFYYVKNSDGAVIRLKNGVETEINTDFTAADFLGFSSTNKAYLGFGDGDTLLKINNGVDSVLTIPDFITCDSFFVDGNYLYYIYSDTTVFLSKYDLLNGAVVWGTDLGDTAAQFSAFQVIKQSTHIVVSYRADLTNAWTLEVYNESSGAFIRSVAVVTDADTIGVWLAVLGTNLYMSYGNGTNSYYQKLPFNSATITAIRTIPSAITPNPLRVFNNKVYIKLLTGGSVHVYNSSDVSLGTFGTDINNITDFIINNGVMIAYSSATTNIKCLTVSV